MKRLSVVFFSVIVMTFGFVGCGGGSSSSNTPQQNIQSAPQQGVQNSTTKAPAQEGLPPVPTIPETK